MLSLYPYIFMKIFGNENLTKLVFRTRISENFKYLQLACTENTDLESNDLHFMCPHTEADPETDDSLYFRKTRGNQLRLVVSHSTVINTTLTQKCRISLTEAFSRKAFNRFF